MYFIHVYTQLLKWINLSHDRPDTRQYYKNFLWVENETKLWHHLVYFYSTRSLYWSFMMRTIVMRCLCEK